jgi:hypothetical protein
MAFSEMCMHWVPHHMMWEMSRCISTADDFLGLLVAGNEWDMGAPLQASHQMS